MKKDNAQVSNQDKEITLISQSQKPQLTSDFNIILAKAMDELIDCLYLDCKDDEPHLKAHIEKLKAKKDKEKLDSMVSEPSTQAIKKRKL